MWWRLFAFLTGAIGRWLLIGGLSAAVVAGAYVKGRMDCSHAAEIAQYEEANRWLNAEIRRRDAKTEADNEARERGLAERERLEEANRNLQNELEDPDRVCLDADDVDRLRSLWP